MKIITAPHPILTQVAHPIKRVDESVKSLAAGMLEALQAASDPEGVGISGNQVGELKRIFIIKPDKELPEEYFINPEILESRMTAKSDEEKRTLEGCLSIPGIWGYVERPNEVKVAYMDLDSKKHEKWFKGFEAVVVQHEIDHLNGILFTQRVLEQGEQLLQEVGDELEPIKTLV